MTLDCKFFNVKNRRSYRCACDICARAKNASDFFSPCAQSAGGLYPGARMSANVLIMQNIPSREGYQYVFFIVDHAMC